MKFYIYVGGKDKRDWALEGINHFKKFLKPNVDLFIKAVSPDTAATRNPKSLFDRVPDGIPIVVLDARGDNYDSESFADFINRTVSKNGKLAFFVGAHAGFSEEVMNAADYIISLSKLTFGHRLSLVILLEQLYRAFDILSGRKYHR